MAMIKCKECGKDISNQATSCPHCGVPVKKPARTFGCGTAIILATVVAIPLVMFMGSPRTGQKPQTATKPSTGQAPVSAPATPRPVETQRESWRYTTSTDGMSGSDVLQAALLSSNRFGLSFPYQGMQSATLIVRRHPRHGIDAIIAIERGQLQCGITDGCKLQVRFDDKPPQEWTFVKPESHDSTILFLRDGRSFASKLSSTKSVRIELKIFQHAPVVAEFDAAGFDNNRLGL